MLFNSIEFFLFLPIVFAMYWAISSKRLQWQNAFLLLASYVFYGWWDWRFLTLIAFSSTLDFFLGRAMHKSADDKQRKLLLATSLVVNLGLLGVFKYFNFFVENFVSAFRFFGSELNVESVALILPVGISFYTFQTLSYSIDVYKRKLEPTNNFIDFLAFVSFFPQLVAGPIERATNLLPQIQKPRVFDDALARDGLRQMLWGLFKKVVVADNCAQFVNIIFQDYGELSAASLAVGAILFAFQIYGDFSGYSDIAIGTSKLLGIRLMTNFRYPYFSRDIAEFWRRWHISLSTWFRDYLYIPLGGSRGTKLFQVRNIMIVFVVSGFWHGANWTFIVWGALNALYFLPLMLLNKNRDNLDVVAGGRLLPSFKDLLAMGSTFAATVIAWIFFRAENVTQAIDYIKRLAINSNYTDLSILGKRDVAMLIAVIGLLLLVEWINRVHDHPLVYHRKINRPLRWISYYILIFLILYFSNGEQEFIYFQF